MRKQERFIDRVMPDSVGGYPVNYGFVPQTVSYDGDPFDALVLGRTLPGGTTVRGAIVGLMHMEDEKGIDSKVVLSLGGPKGDLQHPLQPDDRERIGDYFRRYRQHEPGKFSTVHGWDTVEGGREFLQMTHRFFLDCRTSRGAVCRVSQ
jgi:inorganic pyrophosphatase